MPIRIPFDNAYARLGEAFYSRATPTKVRAPQLIIVNHALARELGIDAENCNTEELAAVFSGNQIPDAAEPLAMAYSGHQFGQLNPQLGDGRAILLGDVLTPTGQRRDIQLKGAGPTVFSRRGDGRAPLGPVLREYIMCEAMAALGVPTTRALAAVLSGEPVIRERREPGAILTRTAASHIRIGTFEYFALRGDINALRTLAEHVMQRHYPHIDRSAADSYLQLYRAICLAQAELIAHWMALGFVHGVMNTDNMTVSGETIDYGPCAFLDSYQPDAVFSYIDRQGRYAFHNQPAIGQWNLARLGECLLPLMAANPQDAAPQATAVLHAYREHQHQHWLSLMSARLGFSAYQTGDENLILSLLEIMHAGALDYHLTLRELSECGVAGIPASAAGLNTDTRAELEGWLQTWRSALAERGETNLQARMQARNPARMPRNHLIAHAIDAAERGDFAPFLRLHQALAEPFRDDPQFAAYATPPAEAEKVCTTFCGT